MKISFMTFACPQWDAQQVIDAAVKYGYHGIEFRTDANHAHGVEVTANAATRGDIRRRLEDAGVEACCLATSLRFATDEVLDEAPLRIELAAGIGCPAVPRVFCGPEPEGFTREQTIEKVGKQLRQAGDIAQSHEVELWIETHDTFSLAVDCAAAVRAADHPAVGINYDNMHPYRNGESLETTVAALGDHVRHTHFHDSVAKVSEVTIKPLDEGELPMDEMMTVLRNMGFTGYLSGEWFGEQYGPTPDASLERFHRDMIALADRNDVTIAKR